jgi:hypothetical protein
MAGGAEQPHKEHDFQAAFENGRSAGNCAYEQKGTTSRVMVANRHTVFDQTAASVPEIMDSSSYSM